MRVPDTSSQNNLFIMPVNYRTWIGALFGALTIIFFVLWWASSGQYVIKSLTENYNILLAAANVHDLRTFLVQDVAASSDPAAHPYWYIHHPNLFAKSLALVLTHLGLNLEAQVLLQLGLNILGLALVVSSFARFSPAAALGALFVAVTSYGSFYFSAGDLARGPTLLIVALLLTALLRNKGLQSQKYNLAVAALSAITMLSDWGLAVFVAAFAFCWAFFESGRPRWGWCIVYIAAPSAAVFLIYEAAVISTVGWDFFLFDARVTYLGRLGTGSALDYREAIEAFRNHNVIIWPPQGLGRDTFLDLVAVLAIMPLLNTGPVWLVLMPISVAAVLHIVLKMRLSALTWVVIAVAVVASIVRIVPMVVIGVVILILASHLGRANSRRSTTELCGLLTCVVFGVAAAAGAFPAFVMGFIAASGRSPFPLLEMTAAALFMHAAATGVAPRLLQTRQITGNPIWKTLSRSEWVVAAVVAVSLITIFLSGNHFFGVPRVLALGLALAVAGCSLILQSVLREYIHPRSSRSTWSVLFARWRIPAAMLLVTLVLASHRSATPTILGRYSPGYTALLSLVVLATCASFALALLPGPADALLKRMLHAAGRFRALAVAKENRPQRAITFVTAFFAIGQIAWFALSVAASPPTQVPYAKALQKPEYRGKIFLTTSFEGMAWYYTQGSAYMTPTNPPASGPLNPRFRHFADWKNEQKYGHPDYFLCDNTGLSFVRPGTSIESAEKPPVSCTQCSCRDSAAALKAAGHTVLVDRPDFSIVRFEWQKLRHQSSERQRPH